MSYAEIRPEEAKRRLDEGTAVCVDIRDADSFAAAHVPGASRLDGRSAAAFVAAADHERALIVCCYHGNSSRGAAAWLASQGFREVYSLTGGIEAWCERFPAASESD